MHDSYINLKSSENYMQKCIMTRVINQDGLTVLLDCD